MKRKFSISPPAAAGRLSASATPHPTSTAGRLHLPAAKAFGLHSYVHSWRELMQKVYGFLACLVLVASTAVFSSKVQAQTYKAIPLDCGGHFSGFAQADNGRLYGYGDVFGAWRSDDGGNNWSYLNWNIPGGDIVGYGMAVQKNNADVVYYSTNDALWKSTNGGINWTALLSDIGDNTPRFRGTSPILIRSDNPNEIWFAGPRKGLTGWLWKSSNGGQDWVKAGGSNFDSNKARTLHNVSTYANQIWVGSDNGLYVSTDGGNNFSLVGGSGRLTDVGMISRFTSGAFAGVGLVTRGTNNGGISRIIATNYNDANTYTVSDAATFNLFFGYPTGLQIFSDGSSSAWNTSGDRHGFSPAGDGGQTFSVRATSLNTNPVPIWTTAAKMAAKNHPDYGTDQVIEAVGNPNKWIITGGGAPMYSLDKGFSWQYFPNGSGLAAVKTYVTDVSRYDANRLYVPASDIGSVIVTDGGSSGIATLSSNKSLNELHNAFRIMEGPNTQNLVLAGNLQSANSNIMLKTSDGGSSWNVMNLSGTGLPLSRDGVTKSVMSFTDANDFLVVLASGTDNPGPITPGTINPGVWRTTNGGANFSQVTGLPSNMSTGARYSGQSAFIERDAVQANVRYFVSRYEGNSPTPSAGLFRSTDGGSNWSFVSHPSGSGAYVWGFCADPVRGGNLWAATDFGGVKVSRDGGQNWQGTAQYFDARFVSSCDGKIAVWGKKDGGSNPELLWYSDDDGATWTAQSTVAKNFHAVQGITVDRNGKIWVSWNSVTVVTPVGAALAAPAVVTQPANQSAVAGGSASFNVAISGNPAPSIQWQRAPNGSSTFSNLTAGGAYSGVNSSTLTVSGITAAMSGDQFRAVGTNSQGNITSSAGTLTVTAAPIPVITSALTRTGNVGTALSYTITATNSPTSYNATNLPAGLSVNTATGLISGTPTASGITNTSISATNAGGTSTVATLVFTINAALPPVPVITSTLTRSGTAGTALSYTITATNSPTSYSATNLPAGLSVNTATGLISGTPTASGTTNTSISATNSGGTGPIATLVFTIAADPNAPVKLTGTVIGTTGSYNNSGNTRDKAFDNNTGTFFDAPGANGNWAGLDLGTAQVIAQIRYFPRDGLGSRMNGGIFQGSSTADFSSGVTNLHTITSNAPNSFTTVTISNATGFRYVRYLSPSNSYGNVAEVEFYRSGSGSTVAVPAITSSLNASATVGTAFSYTITASNSPTSYSATNLPAGLSVNTSTGVISGTPTASGTTNTSISATNAGGTSPAATLAIAVGPAASTANLGFENDFTSWSTYGTASISTTAANVRSGAKSGFFSNGGGNYLVTGLSPNTTYVVRGWVKAVSGTDIWITVSGFGGSQVGAQLTSTSWTQSGNINFTTGAGVTSATLSTWTGATSSAYFDDYTIAPLSASLTNNVILEKWTGIGGTSISAIPVATTPTSTTTLTSLEIPSGTGEEYGVRIRGYIVPTTTGAYTFYIASDDNGELRMSNNDQPVTDRIAYHNDWTGSRVWDRFATQQSAPRNLQAGQKYYFEALMKEGFGGDNLAVGWTGPGISTITVIGSANLDKYPCAGCRMKAEEVLETLVYPNPAGTSFQVTTPAEKSEITVISLGGSVVDKVSVKGRSATIDSSKWKAGVYMLRIQTEKELLFKKVVVVK